MHSEQQIFDYLQQKFGIRFTEQQQAAVQTIDGPVLLLAVPGAGKTTVMVARIANMIFCHGIDPSAILTITFSKAGAQDMRRRYEGLFAAPSALSRATASATRRRCSPTMRRESRWR